MKLDALLEKTKSKKSGTIEKKPDGFFVTNDNLQSYMSDLGKNE